MQGSLQGLWTASLHKTFGCMSASVGKRRGLTSFVVEVPHDQGVNVFCKRFVGV